MKKSKKGYRTAAIIIALIYLAVLIIEAMLFSKHIWYNSWLFVLDAEMLPTIAATLLVIHSIIVYKYRSFFVLPAISALILAATNALPSIGNIMTYVENDMAVYKQWFWAGIGQLASAILYLAIAVIIIARFRCPVAVLLSSLAIGVLSSAANGLSISEYCKYSHFNVVTFIQIGLMGCSLLLEFIIAVFFMALAIYRIKNSPKKLYARSIEERLRDTQNELSSGKITAEEYVEKRKQIIASINIKEVVRDDFKNYGEE